MRNLTEYRVWDILRILGIEEQIEPKVVIDFLQVLEDRDYANIQSIKRLLQIKYKTRINILQVLIVARQFIPIEYNLENVWIDGKQYEFIDIQ